MPETDPGRGGWALPVLLAVAMSAALGFAYLFLTRPNAGELGVIRVEVADESGKGNLRVVVVEAPLAQTDKVTPAMAFTGTVYYPVPYLTRPNLKLICGARKYDVSAETEHGFTWMARLQTEDLADNVKQNSNLLNLLVDPVSLAAAGQLKRGLIFEEFTWEAKGLRAPVPNVPATFEQQGTFFANEGKGGSEHFQIPFDAPPNLVLSAKFRSAITIEECTATGFKWKHLGRYNGFEVTWKARGIRGGEK